MMDESMGKAWIDIRADMGKLKSDFSAVKTAVAGAVTAMASVAVISFSWEKTIGAASDLGETTSKVKTIFGDASATILEEAERMNKAFGVSRQGFMDAASDFGNSFKSIGFAKDVAADMGVAMTKLGMDLASFHNTSNEDAFAAISSALKGEMDPIEKYGVKLNAAAIETQAVLMGFKKVNGEFSQSVKQQAILELLYKQTADAQGDLNRTADGAANQFRKFHGVIDDAMLVLGELFLPIVAEVTTTLNSFMDSIKNDESAKAAWKSFGDTVKSVGSTIGVVFRNIGTYWEMVKVTANVYAGNIAEIIRTMAENFKRIGVWLGQNWVDLIKDAFNAVVEMTKNLAKNFWNLGDSIANFLMDPSKGFKFNTVPLLNEFKSGLKSLPELVKPTLVSLSTALADLREKIFQNELKRTQKEADKALDAQKAAIDGMNGVQGLMAGGLASTIKSTDFNSGFIGGGLAGLLKNAASGGAPPVIGEIKLSTLSGADLAKKIQDAISNPNNQGIQKQLLQGQKDLVKVQERAVGHLKTIEQKVGPSVAVAG